jgi:hypothetical protein
LSQLGVSLFFLAWDKPLPKASLKSVLSPFKCASFFDKKLALPTSNYSTFSLVRGVGKHLVKKGVRVYGQ